MLVRALFCVAVLFKVTCGATQQGASQASLRVTVDPENARVDIDERYAGSARVLAARPKELSPGSHRVSVTADGYYPHDMDVDLLPGETHIEISLRPRPTPQRWNGEVDEALDEGESAGGDSAVEEDGEEARDEPGGEASGESSDAANTTSGSDESDEQAPAADN